jgi:metallo-beta-lactamase family protein
VPDIPIFVDSPMAADVTEIFRQFPDCYDQETWDRMADSAFPLHFPGLKFTRSVEESKQINRHRGPCVIMSTSGMCNAGRIKHHLRQNIDRRESTILFVGFQARGTLGRRILDREPHVRIHGREYPVRAEIRQITGFSAHADQQGLLRWLGSFQPPPRQVFLTHGEESAAKQLADLIRTRQTGTVSIPHYEDAFQLQ